MNPPAEIATLAPQPVLSIRTAVPPDKIQPALADCLPAVFAFMQERGMAPVGPPFARYHVFEPDRVELEAGLPVASPSQGEGRIQGRELPGGEAAVGWHTGPYERLQESHRELERFVQAKGRSPAGGPWEVYWTDPGVVPNPEEWRTQLIQPLA